LAPKAPRFETFLAVAQSTLSHFKVKSVQKKQRSLKDKIMDDKMIKNYFVVNYFVFWVAACPHCGIILQNKLVPIGKQADFACKSA
jgi:hypothetical protein